MITIWHMSISGIHKLLCACNTIFVYRYVLFLIAFVFRFLLNTDLTLWKLKTSDLITSNSLVVTSVLPLTWHFFIPTCQPAFPSAHFLKIALLPTSPVFLTSHKAYSLLVCIYAKLIGNDNLSCA